MIDRRAYLHIQDVIRREGRSFLQYACESFPWNGSSDHTTVKQLLHLADEEREGAASLSRFLAKNHLTPPYLGAYPTYFTSYNYISLDRLVPMLVEHQKHGIVELQADLKALDEGPLRTHVQTILVTKKRHLQELETLAACKH